MILRSARGCAMSAPKSRRFPGTLGGGECRRVRSREGGPMRFLASPRWRIFLIAWMLYSVHFATNVVREHYPAFSISEHGTFYVDEYQGFHSRHLRRPDRSLGDR
jgi:hypothetical protein